MDSNRTFYRVQSGYSFTAYSSYEGFDAHMKASYTMRYEHWINAGKFMKHLDWNDRSSEPSPFISVFDNKADAIKGAQFLIGECHPNVCVAEIRPGEMELSTVALEFLDKTVELPVWKAGEGDDATMFISTLDIRRHLRVPVAESQLSEWFAVDFIPRNMVVAYTPAKELMKNLRLCEGSGSRSFGPLVL